MSKITEADLQALREQMQAALDPLIREKEITLKLGRCKFDPANGNFSFALEGSVKGGLTKEEAAYERLRSLRPKLPPLHSKVVIRNMNFEIVGANSTLSKVIATSNGKRYDVQTSAVESARTSRNR
jgi:hypothetical protein